MSETNLCRDQHLASLALCVAHGSLRGGYSLVAAPTVQETQQPDNTLRLEISLRNGTIYTPSRCLGGMEVTPSIEVQRTMLALRISSAWVCWGMSLALHSCHSASPFSLDVREVVNSERPRATTVLLMLGVRERSPRSVGAFK